MIFSWREVRVSTPYSSKHRLSVLLFARWEVFTDRLDIPMTALMRDQILQCTCYPSNVVVSQRHILSIPLNVIPHVDYKRIGVVV
jgi:hypothetical protein